MTCGAGFKLVPDNETDRVARGYNRYHCYDESTLVSYDGILALDAQIGAASAFIVYGTPDFAILPGALCGHRH